jgi:hypothetical protein
MGPGNREAICPSRRSAASDKRIMPIRARHEIDPPNGAFRIER